MNAERLSRTTARRLVTLLVVVQLVLGFSHLRYGLPHTFHSDSAQIDQAASLLKNGWFADYYNYPLPLVFVYAMAARVTHALEAVGVAGWPARGGASETWPAFVERFQDPVLQHAVGRSVSVLAGALLVIGVYRLGRLRFSRGVSLLAAAAIAVDPVLVITEHQVRPHVPMVAALALSAPLMLRLVARPAAGAAVETLRAAALRALAAGAAAGVVASVLQVGGLLVGTGVALLVVFARPWRRAAVMAAGVVAGTLAMAWALDVLCRATDVVRPVLFTDVTQDPSTFALPRRLAALNVWWRFPFALESWACTAPMLFVGLLAYVAYCWRVRESARDRQGGSPSRDLVVYGMHALVVIVVMGVVAGGHVRYLLTAAPVLAVLAAAACLRARPRWLGVTLAVLLVAQPLAASLRFHALLGTIDTRIGLDALLGEVNGPRASAAGKDAAGAGKAAAAPLIIALQDRLVLDSSAMPPGAIEFPPYDDVKRWGLDEFPVRKALHDSGAVLYARVPGVGYAAGPLDAANMKLLGFRLYGTIRAGPISRLFLPDAPDHMVPDMWLASRTGPPVELWVASDEAAARLNRIAPAEALDDWTRDPAHVAGAVAKRKAAGLRTGIANSLHEVRCDLDGDGTADTVTSNVDAELLARLLALPADRWREAGGELAGAAPPAPHLAARGTLLNDEPVLLLLTGAAPRSRLHAIVGTRELRARFAGGLMVPSLDLVVSGLTTGATGNLAFSAIWPRHTPIGLNVFVQCWIEEPSAAYGFSASNAVAATTPG